MLRPTPAAVQLPPLADLERYDVRSADCGAWEAAMTTERVPNVEPPRIEDEGGTAAVVRILLTAFSFILLLPPWGFIVWFYSVKIVSEYERGVIFRMGRLVGAKGP